MYTAVKNAIMLPVQTVMLAALLPILSRMRLIPPQANRLRLWKPAERKKASGKETPWES